MPVVFALAPNKPQESKIGGLKVVGFKSGALLGCGWKEHQRTKQLQHVSYFSIFFDHIFSTRRSRLVFRRFNSCTISVNLSA